MCIRDRVQPMLKSFEYWFGAYPFYEDAVSYTHLDVYKRQIGDMSLVAQAKVLRALQESRVSPVGSDKEVKVDVRVIAATNKNLQKEIANGKFREDLYHRLCLLYTSRCV